MMNVRFPRFFFPLLAAALLFTQCGKNKPAGSTPTTPAYNAGISAFTSGIISTASTIRVRLSADVPGDGSSGLPLGKDLFRFDPGIPGKAYLTDRRTVEFRPEGKLPPGTKYNAVFFLDRLLPGEKKDGRFEFSFSTLPLYFNVDFLGMRPYSGSDLSKNRISGRVNVSDVVDPAQVEELIVASAGRQDPSGQLGSCPRRTDPSVLGRQCSADRNERESHHQLGRCSRRHEGEGIEGL